MNTLQRAEYLAAAAAAFPILGPISAEDLMHVVRRELGHAEVLDGFAPCGSHHTRAIAPESIVHIVSGNTPHAALQSVIRGLLLGSKNRVKIPSSGLPELSRFVEQLPLELRQRVEISPTVGDRWYAEAGAAIAYGSDETIARIRSRVPANTPFQAHPHRLSFGVVFDDPAGESATACARDAALYDQMGCLSLRCVYVREVERGFARHYAKILAAAMETVCAAEKAPVRTLEEAAAILHLRSGYRFRATSDRSVALWESAGSDAWTVIYEDDPWFPSSAANRVVFVKPLPGDLALAVRPVISWIAAIGIFPATLENAETLTAIGPSRVCPLGSMQFPPWTWHQEGLQTLAGLVRWVDFEAPQAANSPEFKRP